MSIERKESGFHEWHDHIDGVPSLGVETERLDECLAHYRDEGFRGLFGSPTFGFKQEDLDFLAHANNAKWLWFWDIALSNIDALYEVNELEYVGINPKRPGIDFSQFPKLRTVINHWIKSDSGMSQSMICIYHLWHFKPRSKSFESLEVPRGVKTLHLYWANPASLKGLPVMNELEELQLHRCRNLSDLSALSTIAPRLQNLLITTCARIDATAGVLDHPSLKTALIDGKHKLNADR